MTLNKKTFEIVKRNKIFEGITVESSGIDFNQDAVKSFKEGDIIFRKDEPPDFMYLIIEGKVKIKYSDRNIVSNKSEYDFFGEKEITENTVRVSSAVADTNCLVYCIAPQLVKKLLSKDTTISDNILLDNLKTESSDIFSTEKFSSPVQTLMKPQLKSEPVINQESISKIELATNPNEVLEDKINSEELEIPLPEIQSGEKTITPIEEENFTDDIAGRNLFDIQKSIEDKILNSSTETSKDKLEITQNIEAVFNSYDFTENKNEREKKYIEFINYNFKLLREVLNKQINIETYEYKNSSVEIATIAKNLITVTKALFKNDPAGNIESRSIEDLLNEILPTIKEAVARTDIKFLKKITTEASVRINLAAFSSVLYQILKNAIEAMPLGGNIFISAEDELSNVVIKIKDSGNGIPEYQLENIFNEFYTNGKNNSVGLGLYLAKINIEDGGGFIDAESELGEGTTLTIKLPID